MLSYLQSLPDATPAARQRFVVLATVVSFVVILGVWAGVVRLTRRATAPPAATASAPVAATSAAAPVPAPAAASALSGAPASLLEAIEQPAAPPSTVDVEAVANSLRRVFGEPER